MQRERCGGKGKGRKARKKERKGEIGKETNAMAKAYSETPTNTER